MAKRNFVGGEYYYSPSIFFKKKKQNLEEYVKKRFPNKYHYFTGGGLYSLYTILNNIEIKYTDEVLLPSYLCPTILYPVIDLKIKYKFYNIKNNFNIDLKNLNNKISKHTKIIFFINYFGFPQENEVLKVLGEYKQKGIKIIEDDSQSFFSDKATIGNYVFNSFRKYLPIDGSIIISDSEFLKFSNTKNYTRYFLQKSFGQLFRYLTIEKGINLTELFLNQFRKANSSYYKYTHVGFNNFAKFVFNRINIDEMIKIRRENFIILKNEFKGILQHQKLTSDVVPFAYPIISKNRVKCIEELKKKNIYCSVHWNLPLEINKPEYNECWNLSKTILTIPISKKINSNNLNDLTKVLRTS